jgi:superfamily II DNA or RNA helicase
MQDSQLAFDVWCKGHAFGIRGANPPRDWHVEAVTDYATSLVEWDVSSEANGAGKRHVFTIFGGTGSGKTEAAGNLATLGLNQGRYRWVVFVCPNNSILRRAREVFRDRFGIHMELFKGSIRRRGIGSLSHGYITTYHTLSRDPSLHRRICGGDFLVIFDEIHHLGEESDWGSKAEEAFGRVRHFIALTGTPYRNREDPLIPYVSYEDTEKENVVRFKADFPYTLARAVSDGVCRRPAFFYHEAEVKVEKRVGGFQVVSFADTLAEGPEGEWLARERLKGAVTYGSSDRRQMLGSALAKIREAGRKVIIFLGGDTNAEGTPTDDAKETLPLELMELGIPAEAIEVVTGCDPAAQEKIAKFGASDKWILISIAMVSEGTDIPELSSAIFLTTTTAKQTTVQRIGRTLRLMGPDDKHKEAWIFMFRDRFYREISDEIEREIAIEEARAKAKRERDPSDVTAQRRSRTMAIGIGDGHLVEITFGGESYTPAQFEAARVEVKKLGMPSTYVPEFLLLMKLGQANGNG